MEWGLRYGRVGASRRESERGERCYVMGMRS